METVDTASGLLNTAASAISLNDTSASSISIVKNTGNKVEMVEGRDYWYHEVTKDQNAGLTSEICFNCHIVFQNRESIRSDISGNLEVPSLF